MLCVAGFCVGNCYLSFCGNVAVCMVCNECYAGVCGNVEGCMVCDGCYAGGLFFLTAGAWCWHGCGIVHAVGGVSYGVLGCAVVGQRYSECGWCCLLECIYHCVHCMHQRGLDVGQDSMHVTVSSQVFYIGRASQVPGDCMDGMGCYSCSCPCRVHHAVVLLQGKHKWQAGHAGIQWCMCVWGGMP